MADSLTVDLEAAGRAFDRMLAVPWIKQAVKEHCFFIVTRSTDAVLLIEKVLFVFRCYFFLCR